MEKRVKFVVLRAVFSGTGSVRVRARGKGQIMSIGSNMLAKISQIQLSVNRRLVECSFSLLGETPVKSMTPISNCCRSLPFRQSSMIMRDILLIGEPSTLSYDGKRTVIPMAHKFRAVNVEHRRGRESHDVRLTVCAGRCRVSRTLKKVSRACCDLMER